MSVKPMTDLLTTVFLAPGQAALEAEKGYRKIWAQWLEETSSRLGEDASKIEKIKSMLNIAPVMKINGHIELGLTMRIASVQGGNIGISLGTGSIGVSGGYFKQASEESVMSIRATFTMTNDEVDLSTYLSKNGIELSKIDDVKTAIEKLKLNTDKKEAIE